MVLTDIVERHAQQAAFLWHLRRAAVWSPAYDLEALAKLDDRVDANLDGLRIAGDVGWKICEEALGDPGSGEVFVATVLAIEREDVRSLAQILARSARSAEFAPLIVSALGWVPLYRVKRLLDELLASNAPPELHYWGIAGAAVHRHDLGEPLAYAVHAADPRLRARALRAIGELGRRALVPELRSVFDTEDEACRFWAAWSAALLGEATATDVLFRVACEGGVFAERACSMAMRSTDPAIARARIREFAGTASMSRIALAGAAALGDCSMIPWVIDCMELMEHARFAGWAFTMITGTELHAQRLSAGRPQGFRAGPTDYPDDPDVTQDRDASLPWPSVEAVKAWWVRNGTMFPAGRRFLFGKPVDMEWLWQVLRSGVQPAREAAALELSVMSRGQPLFEVRAPGFRQKQALSDM